VPVDVASGGSYTLPAGGTWLVYGTSYGNTFTDINGANRSRDILNGGDTISATSSNMRVIITKLT